MILIGFMGSGKSSIARKLHREGLTYVDLDQYIEHERGLSIPEIFKAHDEAYFRVLEFQALKDVIGKYDVISTGGGVVTYPPSFELLMETEEPVIWLDAPLHILISRTSNDKNRPLARDRKAFRERYKARLDLYKTLSDIRIDTSQKKNVCINQIKTFINAK